MQEKIQPLMDAVTAWRKTNEGKERSKLLTKKKKMSNAMRDGDVDASSYMTVDDVTRFQYLDSVFNGLCKVRDNKKAERKRMREKLEAYRRGRKIDPLSVHNQMEKHSRAHGLDRGAAFGGKYNGKVARKVMENPTPIYTGVGDILKARKAPHITNEYIDNLCAQVVLVMKSWNKFFSILQQKTPTAEERATVDKIAKDAVDRHINLVKNITPKVHIAEDHAVDQYLRLRPGLVRLLIEHWVERNHQDGSRIEEQFRRERKIERRADFVAGRMHKMNNASIRQQITKVHSKGKRITDLPGEYKKKRVGDPITPSPPKRTRTPGTTPMNELEVCLPVANIEYEMNNEGVI